MQNSRKNYFIINEELGIKNKLLYKYAKFNVQNKLLDKIQNNTIMTQFNIISLGGNDQEYLKKWIEASGELFTTIKTPYKPKDILHRICDYLISSFPLIIIIGFFVGMIVTLQLYNGTKDFMQYSNLKLPKSIANSLLIIFAPLLTGILLSGKVGSQIAADIGTKTYFEQIKALESMAINTKRLFFSPIYFAMLFSTTILIFLFFLSGLFGAYLVWLGFGKSGLNFSIVYKEGVLITDIIYVVIKSLVIANVITLISYQSGSNRKNSMEEISKDITSSFVISSILIIFFELIFNYIYGGLK